MKYLSDPGNFSFLLGGVAHMELLEGTKSEKIGNKTVSVYDFRGGLRVTQELIEYPKYDTVEWVNYFENVGNADTQVISELCDAAVSLSLGEVKRNQRTAWLSDPDELVNIYHPCGSNWSEREFSSNPQELRGNTYVGALHANEERSYWANSGRSSGGASAPFFNIHNKGIGAVVAIGWSGNWQCRIRTEESSVSVFSGIREVAFKLLPGERVRTSSFVVMSYEGSFAAAQNKWRAFMKNELSVITKRGLEPPFAAGIWGGMKTEWANDRLDVIDKNEIPFDHVWMDAGWYGATTQPTKSEYEGDWSQHTGEWCISPHIHPDGLAPLSRRIRESGRKFILWFEPERVIKGTPITKEHPEYFLTCKTNGNLLLDLGREEVFNYILEVLTERIDTIGVDCYRQDFNVDPLPFWRENDGEGRCGIHEIKHINNLYRLWDELLARFPSLMIDNCASGGRRIDIETLKRSMPLWRSDAQCPANPIPEMTQVHTANFSLWMPYHGSGSGRCYDTYNFRSAYSASMTTNYTFSYSDSFGDDEKKMAWLKKMATEFRRAKPYFTGDVYHLTSAGTDKSGWMAVQWHRSDLGSGMIQVFKREASPIISAAFKLHGIEEGHGVRISDADGGEITLTYAELCERGFVVTINETRVAKVYFYLQI